MNPPKILALSGSARRESINQALVGYAAGRAREKGGDVTLISLGDYPLPLFDQDEETAQGQPENAARLKALFARRRSTTVSSRRCSRTRSTGCPASRETKPR